MIAGTEISRIVLCPVQPDEDGQVQDVYEPTMVPFRENGHEEMELAREMAQKMVDADNDIRIQIVEYQYTYEDQNLVETIRP